MIYAIVAIFLLASVLLLVALCRTARIFSDPDLVIVTPDTEDARESDEAAAVERDKAA
jgi:hypothetical protein